MWKMVSKNISKEIEVGQTWWYDFRNATENSSLSYLNYGYVKVKKIWTEDEVRSKFNGRVGDDYIRISGEAVDKMSGHVCWVCTWVKYLTHQIIIRDDTRKLIL